jgi:carboxyl-terminal processing protease
MCRNLSARANCLRKFASISNSWLPLAASAFLMDNGDLLLLAVADVTVDDQRPEGVGVRPTIEVPFDPVYAAGRDTQLDRAVQVLSERIKGH